MSVNFPTNRPEANLGSGDLQLGDVWVYNSITYTWVETPNGTGMWSSKGINFNPNLFIEKADSFEDNGGVISGAYNGGANQFAVSYAASSGDSNTLDGLDSSHFKNASNLATGTISDALLPSSISSNITGSADKLDGQDGSFYQNANNLTAGTISDDRLPTTISSNITGKANTAGVADQVANPLTINFYSPGLVPGVNPPTDSVVFDGSQTGSNATINITDTDSATAIIDLAPGDGLREPSPNTLAVNDTVARYSGGYVREQNLTTKLKSGYADNANLLDGKDSSHYLNYNNLTNKPTIVPGTVYTSGDGITISSSDSISVKSDVARTKSTYSGTSGSYVVNSSNQSLKVYRADTATNDSNGKTIASREWVGQQGYSTGTPTLNQVLTKGRFSGGQDLHISDELNSVVDSGISLYASGSMQLDRYDPIADGGPFIDFTRGLGTSSNDPQNDYECRIKQLGKHLILETREGGAVKVQIGSKQFTLTENTGGDGNGGIPDVSGEGVYGRTEGGWSLLDQSVNTDNFGADTHWDELTGTDDNARFQQFVSYVNNGNRKSLFVPGGKTIRLTSTHTFINKVGFVGPPAALGANLPGILFSHNSGVGLNCTAGIRARNFKFDGTGKDSGSESSQPTTLIRVGTFNPSNNEDDIDSSFRFCEFGEKHDGNILQFNGRNVNVGNCAFSNCKGGATLLKLQWDGIQEDPSNDGDAFYATSWRKNRIYNNQFHVHDSCLAIDVDGKHPIGGLAITDNISDTGANLLLIRGAGTNGCTVSGNVWYGRNLDEAGVIRIGEGTIHGMCITGNSFSGFHETVIQREPGQPAKDVTDRPENFIKVTSPVTVLGLAITGNTFSYCTGRAIDIADDADKQKTSVTGNVFTETATPPYPENAVVHAGNVY